MTLTQSIDLPLGSSAPEFVLPSAAGGVIELNSIKGINGTVVLFICNHCPYVIHIAPALSVLASEYMARGIAFIAINSNDADAYPADSFEKMQEEVIKRQYPFAYAWDESQQIAKAYRAACTPDIYVFDRHLKLFYHGQFDDTRPRRIGSGHYDSAEVPATGADLRYALDCLLEGSVIDRKSYPAMGCNIKWKP